MCIYDCEEQLTLGGMLEAGRALPVEVLCKFVYCAKFL